MQKLLVSLAAFGLFAAPAMAQVAPAPQDQAQAQAAPAEKPKTVKKTVCKNVEEERSIGSRLAPTTKICRVVEVPAPAAKTAPQANGAR
jgi:hypothetical protein